MGWPLVARGSAEGPPSPLRLQWATFACQSSELAKAGLPTVARTEAGERRLVDQNGASWNRIANWLRRVEVLREAA